MFFLKRIRNKITERENLKYLALDKSVSSAEITVLLRNPTANKKYLSVREGSVVQCKFVFERESGQVSIGTNSFIGGSTIICIDKIEIGNDVLISWGCTIIDNDAHSLQWELRKNDVSDWKRGIEEGYAGKYKKWENVKSAPIKIQDRVWIGFNSTVLKGVTIGEGAVVGAGSVVVKDVPPFVVVAGNPARIVKDLREK